MARPTTYVAGGTRHEVTSVCLRCPGVAGSAPAIDPLGSSCVAEPGSPHRHREDANPFTYWERAELLLAPLRRLQQSAVAIADGHYEVALPRAANDEIGMLSQAFGVMAAKVRSHTEELETRVRQRTEALQAANQAMAAAHQTIDASIGYASLIQRAFLIVAGLPPFSGRHDMTRASLFGLAFELRLDEVAETVAEWHRA